jgi:ATP-dependent DNA helicase RecQ
MEYRPPFRGRGLKILSRVPVSQLNINFQEIERRSLFERKKLKEMIDYAYTDQCLRRFILEYFGERITRDNCDNCSSCLDEGETHTVRTLLRKERIVKEKPPKKLPKTFPEESDLPCHEDLFVSLKEMRLKLAQASNLPAFVIFHDRVLRAISQRLPQTTSELHSIKGCGEYKVSAYGNQTLEVVRAYLKNHPEARPLRESDGSAAMQPVVKKTTGGSTVEITWMLWEKGGTLKEIAQKRGLTPSTISEHLVQLIGEGRSIDLNRILSKERIALIKEAIVRAGSERLAPIRALLPQDVTYDEIRLVLGQSIQKGKGEDKKR